MRLESKCIGDCSKCQLLADGEVDMIPCILDQIFIRARKNERELSDIRVLLSEKLSSKDTIQLAGLDEPTVLEDEEI